ncbi:class I SAM-dependent methyltransferase [Embleya sp. NPDC005971]|uniref:class I SAM-dependent methyltransferase n=1 Tax=Embleya sp. NPDC005971 TaxID=3156724 RepID=UPI00340E1E19
MPETTAAERIAALGYDYGARAREHLADCNLCGTSGRAVEVARRDRYGYPATLLVCERCGLGYLSPRLSASDYAHFYDGVYRPLVTAYHGRRIDAETVQREQREYGAELAAFLGPLLPSSTETILDVGGSTGVVAGVLAERLDARATVLDPSPDELAAARSAGMETVAGFAEDFDPGERDWDLVLLCQTIDHLRDVRGTLAALRRMTAPGGHAFVDIVDVDIVLRRTGAIEHVVKIDHPFYLTRPTAAAFFAVAGYSIVAERVSADGHRGFVLAPGARSEPDWHGLGVAGTRFLAGVRALRTHRPA